jgi:ribose transport system substrate-binding protein
VGWVQTLYKAPGRSYSLAVRFLTLLSLALSLAAAGCDAGSGPRERARTVHRAPAGATLKLAFVTNNTSEFWNIAKKGIEKAESELKVQIDLKQPDPAKLQEQVRILENLESQGYHGIAISVLHPTDINRQLNRIAGTMNLITHDSDAPTSNRLVYIGTDNFQAGRILGGEIARLFPRGGKMAVFVGDMGADNARQRLAGLQAALKDAGSSFSLEATKEDEKDPNRAKKNVEDVLNGFPDIDLLVGLWAYNGPAIASALKAAGKTGRIRVVAFDEDEQTLQAIKDGIITCTIAQKPYQFGYLASVLLCRLAREGEAALPRGEVIDTGVTVVSAANVDPFWAALREEKR